MGSSVEVGSPVPVPTHPRLTCPTEQSQHHSPGSAQAQQSGNMPGGYRNRNPHPCWAWEAAVSGVASSPALCIPSLNRQHQAPCSMSEATWRPEASGVCQPWVLPGRPGGGSQWPDPAQAGRAPGQQEPALDCHAATSGGHVLKAPEPSISAQQLQLQCMGLSTTCPGWGYTVQVGRLHHS